MSALLIFPILLPLAGGVIAILVKTDPKRSLQLALTGTANVCQMPSGMMKLSPK